MDVDSGATDQEKDASLGAHLSTKQTEAAHLNDKETLILKLYDQLEELRLEQSILDAQISAQEQDLEQLSDDEVQEQLRIAEREALEARASYMLRNRIVQNVLIADPVLKAIYSSSSASLAERRLLPLIAERDVISMIHSSVASKISTRSAAAAKVEHDTILSNHQNKQLAQSVLSLAEELKSQETDEINDPVLRSQLEGLDQEIKKARRDWRVMKSVVSSTIVGSGVEWARDDQLRELVMDDEDGLE